MAQMTASQIAIELQRKKAAGERKASDPANQAALDKLWAQPAPGTTAQPSGVGVRDFLSQNGINDVGFDNNTKTVTVGGQSFIKPKNIVNGNAYDSKDDLTSALVGLQNRNSTKKVQGLMGQIETAINAPPQPKEWNYNLAEDPIYKAALNRAAANAQTASGNAMAELNRRGILNSTITGDRLGQIQQAEYGRVSDELVPQLYAQAYNRHRDEVIDDQTAYRNRISDLATLLGLESDTNQRNIDNFNNDRSYNRGVFESDRNYDRNNFESDRNFGRGVFESDRSFNRGVKESDRNFDRGVFESDRNYNRGVTESDRNYENTLAQTALDYERYANPASGSESKSASGLTPNQIYDAIRSQFATPTYDADGRSLGSKLPTNEGQRATMIVQLLQASKGLPDAQREQIAASLGISREEWKKVTGHEMGE